MSDTVRLTFVSHAMTDAMSAGRFPRDEPLNDLGRRQVSPAGIFDRALCGPEARTRQTADLLGLKPEIDSQLTDMDCGSWAGLGLDELRPAELTSWLTEPNDAPHGGESVMDMVVRVRNWLSGLPDLRLVAVSHPAVIRAALLIALDAPPISFWRIDVEPAGRTVLYRRAGRWTLRLG